LKTAKSADVSFQPLAERKAKTMGINVTDADRAKYLKNFKALFGAKETYDTVTHYEKLRETFFTAEYWADLEKEVDRDHLKELSVKLRKARSEKLEAEKLSALAQEAIEKFSGMSLDDLKKEFEKTYGNGPGKTAYDNIDFSRLLSLLDFIKDKEPSKKLDSKFQGYEDKIIILQDQMAASVSIYNT